MNIIKSIKQRIVIILFFSIIFSACSTVRVPYKDSIPLSDRNILNERIKVKKIDIFLKDGRVLKDRITRIREDGIIYEENGDYLELKYDYINEIHINPQVSSMFYVGLGLFGLGTYFLVSGLSEGDNPTGDNAGSILVPFIVYTGSGYFFYKGIETKKTILQFN
jgi:hypothetical protein